MPSCVSNPKPVTAKSSLREKLNQLSYKLAEKQNQIENLKTENKILKKLMERENEKERKKRKALLLQERKKRASQNNLQAPPRVLPSEKKEKPKTTGTVQTVETVELLDEALSDHLLSNELNEFQQKNSQFDQFEFQQRKNLQIRPPDYALKDPEALEFNASSFEESFSSSEKNPNKEKNKMGKRLPAHHNSEKEISKLYSKALQAYKALDQKRLNQLALFSLQNQPNNFYTDDILFLSGKLDAKKGLYKKAIRKWNRILEKYSNSNKKASALLWTGVVYQKLKLKNSAFTYFQRLILEHPESPEAHLARKKITRAKVPSK